MKNTFMKNLIAAVCLLFASTAFAQTYTSGGTTVNVSYNASHDSTQCTSGFTLHYNIIVTGTYTGDVLNIVDSVSGILYYSATNTTGASPWNISCNVLGSITDDYDVPTGGGPVFFNTSTIKVIHSTDTVFCPPVSTTVLVTNPCIYNTVSGKVYADINGDCVYNAGDIPLHANMLSANSWFPSSFFGPGWPYVYIDPYSAPEYSAKFQESWMDSVSVFIPSYYSFIFPGSSCFTGSYTFTTLPHTNADFPLQPTANLDVQCAAGSSSSVRVATPFYVHPYVSNIGFDSASGTLTLVKDSRTTYNAALSANPATYVSGDTLSWNYSGLTCIGGGAYWNSFMAGVHLTPNSTVVLGDNLCFHVFTGVLPADVNAANNDYSFCLPVVNSYDPNVKEVSPAGTGSEGYIPASTPELTYTIHFQNTGNAPALVVKVVDTLDADVDPASLKIIGNSHAMTPEWLAPGVVSFNFDNINLADSLSNEPESHGFVRFSVKPDAGLAPGTQIKNKGYIYFDTNPAVITNTALNTIEIPSTVSATPVRSNVKVYPNPATEELFVEGADGTITITSVTGQNVLTTEGKNKNAIDISRLAAGVYIVKVGNNVVNRFVKQ